MNKSILKTVFIVIVGLAIVGALGFAALLKLDSTMEGNLKSMVTIGDSKETVIARMGEYDRISYAGAPLDPPHVSGFTPTNENHNFVLTYFYWRFIVFVFFDENEEVDSIVICEP